MGTSGSFGGSKSGLVPSWVDEPAASPVAAPDSGRDSAPETGAGGGGHDVVAPTPEPDGDGDSAGDAGADGHGDADAGSMLSASKPYPRMPTVPARSGLRSARGNITRGARTGDSGAIRRGAGQYVRASGGGGGAARRMPNSRAVAGGVARLARALANQGPAEALRRFNLDAMAGAPAEDVFLALSDMLCPAGGTIDEAIARDAMLETVADLAAAGVGNFDELSTDGLHEFFIGVVSRSIEGKIANEIGTNAVSVPADIAGIERAQNMLHDFVEGCVRDEFDERGTDIVDLDSNAIDSFVDDLYAAALELIAALGENE